MSYRKVGYFEQAFYLLRWGVRNGFGAKKCKSKDQEQADSRWNPSERHTRDEIIAAMSGPEMLELIRRLLEELELRMMEEAK